MSFMVSLGSLPPGGFWGATGVTGAAGLGGGWGGESPRRASGSLDIESECYERK